MRKWQQYTPEFKAEALRRLKGMRERWRARPRAEGAPGHPVQAGGRSRKKRSGPVVDSPAIAALKKESFSSRWLWRINRWRQIFSKVPCKARKPSATKTTGGIIDGGQESHRDSWIDSSGIGGY
jgi:hypothetical protein